MWQIKGTKLVNEPEGITIHCLNEQDAIDRYAAMAANGRCRECTDVIDLGFTADVKKQLQERQLCFKCNFWTEQLDKQSSKTLVVNGTHYTILPDDPNTRNSFKGHGGTRFDIEFLDGREPVTTRNLWCQGDVPEHFRSRLPDNAKFVRPS